MTDPHCSKRTRARINDYQDTVLAIGAFAHFLRWNDNTGAYKSGTWFLPGRRMTTSTTNRHRPHATVTPDLVVQLSSQYGVVGEARGSMPRNRDLWLNELKQLEKYDDDLKGWKTPSETVDISDIALLTHNLRKVDVGDFLQAALEAGTMTLSRRFAVVAFARVSQAQEYFSLERSFGEFSDPVLDDRLRRVVEIPLEPLIAHYPARFYDAKPPLPLTLYLLWDYLFSKVPPVEEYMATRRRHRIEVNVRGLTDEFRNTYYLPQHDERQPTVPETSWIREALEFLVKHEWAERQDGSSDHYVVHFRFLKDSLDRFIRMFCEDTPGEDEGGAEDQLSLFNNADRELDGEGTGDDVSS